MLEAPEEEEPSIGIQVVDTDDASGSSVLKWNFEDASLEQFRAKRPQDDRTWSLSTSSASPVAESFDPSATAESPRGQNSSSVEIVEDYEEPRASSLPRSSDSTITPTLPPTEAKEPVIGLNLPLPHNHPLTPETLLTSTFSSPDFSRSQTSFDVPRTPRLGTATSSSDCRTANSSLLGEPGPELRVSVDDVPSLTSSRSTMNSAINHASTGARHFAERSASLASASSTTLETRRKRSSIASLSQLMGRSFGEKSKLSIEQRPSTEGDDTPRPAKTKKKKHRLSKMMHFWKSKESLRS